jgi:hypothetical protein
MLRKKSVKKEGRIGKKEGCLRAFFLIFFTKYWGKKNYNTICLQKKSEKEKL